MDAAERRLDQLTSFAGLAALDPTSGITVGSEEVGGVTVTTIGWSGAAELGAELPVEAGALTMELRRHATTGSSSASATRSCGRC